LVDPATAAEAVSDAAAPAVVDAATAGTVAVRDSATPAADAIAEIVGVVMVGDACMTNVDPVPVCDATAVARPVDVIGPVRFPAPGVPVSCE
jgi:hypothetical protein